MNSKYERLFESRKLLGGKTVKNPMVMSPMTTFAGQSNGNVSEAELLYYKRRAKNVGMVITATTYVTPSGKGFSGQFAAYSDEFLPSLKLLAQTIKEEGALAILQIFHAGRMALPNEIPNGETISASAVAPVRAGTITPREMTDDEIYYTIKAFGETTRRAILAGFDGVEIHGANTYLIQQFFSPHSNRRNDNWGGNIEKRMKFPLAVIDEVNKAVKNEGKSDFIVGYRFSPEELENPGITLEDTLAFVDVLSKQDLNYLHVSLNNFWQGSIRNNSITDPTILKIKDKIEGRVPLIGVGSIHTPDEALKALDSGIEFLALGRELIMEPEWLEKVKDDKIDEIRTSISKSDKNILDIPEVLWENIINAPGWFPITD
ncbi:NADH-dependent flavin oxidoreductase [Clostridium folliculivorans]|uniref:NADH-dependent flavin oxidoreductase YqiG n=1 Tax=Clostridium folliculivorans TaxID=2886038 RepID=A0A9W5Y1Q0_9CLOT|nr:NADH-dependent flavin oxidoreductase [Clostridium folliculivorans]GKU24877.1 putative NADH-dependent flavin oxidoreductase YqiG [Clostridium folliculivorans]GKU30975.1 putative NADH-dependent flavin oxidoreductase YqiG [Clostridium folliculivorans]